MFIPKRYCTMHIPKDEELKHKINFLQAAEERWMPSQRLIVC